MAGIMAGWLAAGWAGLSLWGWPASGPRLKWQKKKVFHEMMKYLGLERKIINCVALAALAPFCAGHHDTHRTRHQATEVQLLLFYYISIGNYFIMRGVHQECVLRGCVLSQHSSTTLYTLC